MSIRFLDERDKTELQSAGVHIGSDEPTGNETVWINPNGEASGTSNGFHFVSIAGTAQSDDTGWDCYYEKSSYEEIVEAFNAGKVVVLQFKLPSGGAYINGITSMMTVIQVDDGIYGIAFTHIMGDTLLGIILNQDGSITCDSTVV